MEIAPAALLADLQRVQVVFIGEFHDHVGHHQAQLAIIESLDDAERPLAVGLEMFRRDSQASLDRWTAGDLSLHEFLKVYDDNWSLWPAYREIFLSARSRGLKMLGLNIPRSLTAKVMRSGFASLTAAEREALGNVQCVVSPAYGGFIRQALGVHSAHGDQYQHFCEAQLLWDTMMARNLLDFLKENPDYRVVVLAGSGHAWKFGIPRQVLDRAEISYRVLLPEAGGRVDRENVTTEIADYLWLDVGEDGWTFSR
jgi:uncharacterized iron-regulated protein